MVHRPVTRIREHYQLWLLLFAKLFTYFIIDKLALIISTLWNNVEKKIKHNSIHTRTIDHF